MKTRASLFCLLAAFLWAMPATAHRVGVPTTTIEQNPASGVWEITHRVSAHDLDEVFAGKINPLKLYSSDQGVALIENYVTENFAVSGAELQLTYIGAELDGDFVYIYSEMTTEADAIAIDSALLLELPGISAVFVNVNAGGEIRTAEFGAASGPIGVSLRPERDTPDLLP